MSAPGNKPLLSGRRNHYIAGINRSRVQSNSLECLRPKPKAAKSIPLWIWNSTNEGLDLTDDGNSQCLPPIFIDEINFVEGIPFIPGDP